MRPEYHAAMTIVRFTTTAALLLLFAHTAAAQSATAGAPPARDARGEPGATMPAVLTLAEALKLAAANHPLLQDAAGRRLLRVGEASSLAAFANPHVEWRREGIDATGGADDFLTVALPLALTGRQLLARGVVGATDRAATADSQSVARAVLFDAARAWHRAALAVALADVADRQRTAMGELARYDSTRWREGAVAEGVALRTALEADRSSAGVAMASVQVSRQRASLAGALGVPSTTLPPPPPLTTAALADLGPLPPLDSLRVRAIAQRPEMRAARAAVQAAERREMVERLGVFGDVALAGGTRRSGGETSGIVALGISVPLLDRNGPARQRAHGELLRARAALRQTELAIGAEVAAAAESYERLRTGVLPIANGAGARGTDIAQIVQAAYREGGATLLELLDARRAAAEIDAAALQWITDLELARLDLLQALGDPLPEAF